MTSQGSEWIITCFALRRNEGSIVFDVRSVQYVFVSLSPCCKIYAQAEGGGSWAFGSAETWRVIW